MKRADLFKTVVNVLMRCGVNEDAAVNRAGKDIGLAAKDAAAMAFTRNLTEDDDTRRLRWQHGDLVDNGKFTLED
jgi:hypothetical protein